MASQKHSLATMAHSSYSSTEFAQFADSYRFAHSTSSPHYPQSNGLVERTVKTVKKLLKESADPCMALLSYRTTTLPWCGLSLAELSQGRHLRSDIPQTQQSLVPQWPFTKEFRQQDEAFKLKQKQNFDSRHMVKPLSDIPEVTEVSVTSYQWPIFTRPSCYSCDCSKIVHGQHSQWHDTTESQPAEHCARHCTTAGFNTTKPTCGPIMT